MEKVLSIVIPAYNVEKYLEKCLSSFEIEAVLDRIEILVINDGSGDHTAEIAQRYCEKYPETYFLYNKENGGHGSGINYGIRYATGKYFKVVDGDDWLNTEELEAFVKLLEETDTDIVAADFLCIQDETDAILEEKHCTPCKEQYGHIADLTKGEVMDVIKMHALTIRTAILKQNPILYMYRLGRNGQSMDIRSMQKNRMQHQRVLDSLLKFYVELHGLSDGSMRYIERCIAQVVENQFQIYISMGCDKKIQEELRQWDLELKKRYPDIYGATRKKSITMLRKTGYRILPVGAVVYRICKNR